MDSLRCRIRVVLPWLGVAVVLMLVLAASLRAMEPPKPLGADAPLDRFSESRARDIVYQLSEQIGRRVNGTSAYARAVEYLDAELRKIPGVEAEIYPGSGTYVHRLFPASPIVYRNLNVLGRLPGKNREAILLDAHFDTLQDSAGAADDAAGVACILEVVRALAREAPLDRSILVNLNGGEESGLLGAAAFLKHPWAEAVHAYIYLEALPGGKAFLIGAGPNQPWLAKAYAQVVSAPVGNIVGQELTQSGLLPFNGDFQPFHAAGLVGLDIAMTGDAYRVHTELDRLEALQPGGLQHLGDATLAVTRVLANRNTALRSTTEPVVYYDLVGKTMVAYPIRVARVLGVVALSALVLLLVSFRARRRISLMHVLGACGWHGLALLVAVLAALLPAVGLRWMHRGIGWFGTPWLLIVSSVLPASAGFLFVHGAWRYRAMSRCGADPERVALTAWMGGVVFWGGLLLLATLKGIGAGYIALSWVLGGVVGALVGTFAPRARWLGALIGLVPGALVTTELACWTTVNFVPMVGMFPVSVPVDGVVVGFVAAVTGLIGILSVCAPCRKGGARGAAVVCALAGLAGILASALHFPYSPTHPKRLAAIQAGDSDNSALLLASSGADGMDPLLSFIPDARPAPATWPTLKMKRVSHLLPAPLPAMAAPRLEVISERFEPSSNERHVRIHLDGTSPHLTLSIPKAALAGWSATKQLVPLPAAESHYHLNLEGVPSSGVELELDLRDTRPVEIELLGVDGAPATGPEIRALRQRLPDWVTLATYSYRRERSRI